MRNAKGFTLIELLIVIAIIAILAAVLIPNVIGARKRANDSATQGYMRQVATFVESYLAANPANKVGDLTEGDDAGSESGECNEIEQLTKEGLSASYPASVLNCKIVNDGKGGYGIKAKSVTGTWWALYAGKFINKGDQEPTGDPAEW
ncbi:prepilin-type N-terminal cleavage/methylation domain-containing protein [Thermus caliditerrae]|uniref:prepilin-type N-terminal cleavage/methylation domain-containing protein n=1 Tax=Thermus caliditerrae TaxID=1330700 RepID=UPI000570AB41|nr:prepilin-type N-terminal cleavage/methylation domain-containing protein [Thermus caliditerrae]